MWRHCSSFLEALLTLTMPFLGSHFPLSRRWSAWDEEVTLWET